MTYNPLTDSFYNLFGNNENLYPKYKSIQIEDLQDIFPLEDNFQSFSSQLPDWVSQINEGEFIIEDNLNRDGKKEKTTKEQSIQSYIPDPVIYSDEENYSSQPVKPDWWKDEWNWEPPGGWASSEYAPKEDSQNTKPDSTEMQQSTQQTTQQSTKQNNTPSQKVGTNRFTQSPLYEWDGKNRISKSSTAKNMMDIYKSMNIPSHIASAIIGHIYAESGFNSIKRNSNDVGQVSTGLIQWDSKRLKRLKEFAKSKNKSWSDISTQLEFILYEMKNYYPKYYNDLMSSTTPAEATEAMAGYILFAGWNGSTNTARRAGWSQSRINLEHKNRQNYAQEIYRNWGY